MGKRHREISQYNAPYNEYLSRYSDTTVYWLTWNEVSVKRAAVSDIYTISEDTLSYYTDIKHYEVDNWFDYSTDNLVRREHPYWIENKTWGWHAVYPGTSTYNFSIDELVHGNQVKLYTKFQSYASFLQDKAHLVALGINNYAEEYDKSWINKFDQKILQASVSSDLVSQDNTLKLISFPTESSVNTLFFDWYEVEYPRYLNMKNDSLIFRFTEKTGKKNIKLKNLNAVQYSLWKTGALDVKFRLSNESLTDMVFSDSISTGDEFFILSESKIMPPLLEKPKRFINLRNSRQSDYILITNSRFLDAAFDYKKFLESYYLIKVDVIDVQDIYDEYTYGNFNPEAIRLFLQSTYKYWQDPLPDYVLLAGDGTYDYHRNKEKYQGAPRIENYVPSFGSPVSDNWFVSWDTTGAHYPAMNIGRIPVKTNEEFYSYLNKHKNYISRKFDDWNKRYLFFSGGSSNNEDELNQLKFINQKIIDSYITPAPIGGRAVHFYKTLNPVSNYGPMSPAEIWNSVDSSGLFISYLGHSGTQTWDNGIVDPSQLSNTKNRYPLITDFGCSTGKFAEPDIQSFAELFINKWFCNRIYRKFISWFFFHINDFSTNIL